MPDAAKALFVQSMSLGWDKKKGGFFYTLDWADKPAKTNKLWWRCARLRVRPTSSTKHSLR